MRVEILVLNCGSSSTKYARFSASGLDVELQVVTRGLVAGSGGQAVRAVLEQIEGVMPEVVGHRVVHGGSEVSGAVYVDIGVERAIEAHAPLAPVHNPAALEGIHAVRAWRPELRQIAVFDTAFHQTLPPHAYVYALPYFWAAFTLVGWGE